MKENKMILQTFVQDEAAIKIERWIDNRNTV